MTVWISDAGQSILLALHERLGASASGSTSCSRLWKKRDAFAAGSDPAPRHAFAVRQNRLPLALVLANVKRIGIALSALALLAGCGSDGGASNELSVSLAEQNGSTQSGDATLTAVDDSTTRVEISIGNGGDTPQPAHIHKGSCANLDPQPEYALEDVVAGESSTSVNVPLDELRDGDFAINVHKSAAALQVYVACGDIGSAAGGTTTETGEEDSGGYGERY
jgi:hypothetical protein